MTKPSGWAGVARRRLGPDRTLLGVPGLRFVLAHILWVLLYGTDSWRAHKAYAVARRRYWLRDGRTLFFSRGLSGFLYQSSKKD